MFTAADFRLIRKNCLSDLELLLKNLSINLPNFDSGDEFKIYDDLDKKITDKICRLMKSSSVIDGYTKLLKLGGISYNYSETDNDLLSKIVANKNKIFQGLESASEPEIVEISAPQQVNSAPRTVSRPSTKKVTRVENTPIIPAMIFGIVLILISAVGILALDFGIMAGVLIFIGIILIIIGARGTQKKITETITVNSVENISDNTPVNSQSVRQTIVERRARPTPFTPEELRNLFSILTQANKIACSI